MSVGSSHFALHVFIFSQSDLVLCLYPNPTTRFRGLRGHTHRIVSSEMSPKPADRSVTELPATPKDEGNRAVNGTVKREWICRSADTGTGTVACPHSDFRGCGSNDWLDRVNTLARQSNPNPVKLVYLSTSWCTPH